MSNDAMTWAMDQAPMLRTDKGKPDTTARHVLQVLAEHAHDDGTSSHPSVLRIQYRTGYDRTTVQRALRRLETGGLIKRDGVNGGRSNWKLAMDRRRPATDWGDLEREEESVRIAAAERKRKSRSRGVTGAESVTVTDSEAVTVTGVKSVTSGRHGLNAPPSQAERLAVTGVTPSRHRRNAALTTNQPSGNQLQKTSSSAPAAHDEGDDDLERHLSAIADESAGLHQATLPTEDHSAFVEFWLIYPKSRDKTATLAAWKAAVADGADPKTITAAAAAYRKERAGEPDKFTKFSANWLRDGRYEDVIADEPANGKPNLRAVKTGGHSPFQLPADHSAYGNGF